MHTSGIFGPDGVEVSRVQRSDIRYGVVIHLPFRLRITGLMRVPPADESYDVWLFNRIAVPPGSHLPAILYALPNKERDGYAGLWTDAVIILHSPELTDAIVDEVRHGNTSSIGLGGNLFRTLTCLNEVIFGYSEATGTIFGGAGLRLLTDMEFFGGMRLEFAFVSNGPYQLTRSDVMEIIEYRPDRQARVIGGQLTGDLTDLPDEAVADVPRHISAFRARAYLELAFRAKMAMLGREPVVALVLACAALEGAHADVLRQFLSRLVGTADGKDLESMVESLLREQGIYTLIQLTSLAFIDTEFRPPQDALDRCLQAITMRNSIVHARQKRGQYRLRSYTFNELNEAYKAVFEIFSAYLKALGSSEPRRTER